MVLKEQIVPDKIHVLVHGRIVANGGMELLDEIDQNGYAAFQKEAVA